MTSIRVEIPCDLSSGFSEDELKRRCLAGLYKLSAPNAYQLSEYSTWQNMRARCMNENAPHWKHYGGRGISVCSDWDCFWMFLADVGHKPEESCSLDRIDVNGNYEPGNVRWCSKKDQSRNRRDTFWINYEGEEMCVEDWSERTGISSSTIRSRLKKGWSIEDALLTQVYKTKTMVEFRGEVKTISDWARILGISSAALGNRLRNWPKERALTEKPSSDKVLAGKKGAKSRFCQPCGLKAKARKGLQDRFYT